MLLKFLYFGKDSTVTLQTGYKVQLHRIGQRAPEAKGAEQYIHVGKIESTGSQLTDTENNEVDDSPIVHEPVEQVSCPSGHHQGGGDAMKRTQLVMPVSTKKNNEKEKAYSRCKQMIAY